MNKDIEPIEQEDEEDNEISGPHAEAPLENFRVSHPVRDEVDEEMRLLESIDEYRNDSRGDSLTFGDY